MGLDSVELLMEVENIFDVTIPDVEAAGIDTVSDFVDSVCNRLEIKNNNDELIILVFERLKLFLSKYQNKISLDTLIVNLIPSSFSKKDFKTFKKVAKLELPIIYHSVLNKIDYREITMRLYIEWVISLNYSSLLNKQIYTRFEVERIICGVVNSYVGVPIDEILLSKSIHKDLGVD